MTEQDPFHTVLVVEDDPDIRACLQEVLEEEHYLVHTAANGRQALRELRTMAQLPAVVLLDLMMPVMNGWQFLARLRQDDELKSLPVVIVTAADSDVPRDAVAVLHKPFDLDRLLELTRRFDAR